MPFDPEQLPLADFGLSCKGCGYPLANLTRLACPECGRAVDLESYIPEGAMPALWADGEPVKLTADIAELFGAYGIPFVELHGPTFNIMPGMSHDRDRVGAPIAVPRSRYFEAIDLLRRVKLDEELPPPPEPTVHVATDWDCPVCGEENPGHFEVCWSCQGERGENNAP